MSHTTNVISRMKWVKKKYAMKPAHDLMNKFKKLKLVNLGSPGFALFDHTQIVFLLTVSTFTELTPGILVIFRVIEESLLTVVLYLTARSDPTSY